MVAVCLIWFGATPYSVLTNRGSLPIIQGSLRAVQFNNSARFSNREKLDRYVKVTFTKICNNLFYPELQAGGAEGFIADCVYDKG